MICVYMSDERVKLIEGSVSGGKIVVKKFDDFATTDASIDGTSLKNLVGFTQLVQEWMQEKNIKPQDACYVIDNSRVVFRDMEMPDVPESKIKQMISAEIFSDAKTNNNTVDFIVDSHFKNAEKKPRVNIVVTYTSNDVIENIHTSGTEIGLKPVSLDVSPNAMSKLIQNYTGKDRKLLEKGKARKEGDDKNKDGDTFTFMLVDYKDTFITMHVFDNMKRKFSKSTMLYLTDTETIVADELIDELSKNINSVIRFFESRNYDKPIEDVFFTGNVAILNEDGIMQELANRIGSTVSQLPIPSFVSGMSLMDFNTYSCALGAMLRRR